MSSCSSSAKEEEAEAIMICLDNSHWMESTKSPMFKEQADAIELYCNIKLKSHSLVGVCAMADAALGFMFYPTNDIDKIMDTINDIPIGGELRFLEAAANAHSGLVGELYTSMKKRIVFFAGGSLYFPKEHALSLGAAFNEINLACDVITFGYPYFKKSKFINCFIQSANNKGNCNSCLVPPESSISEALSRSQIIIPHAPASISGPPSTISGRIDIYVKAASDPTDDAHTDCPFCQRVILTLEEKKVSYNTTFISLDNKPEWFDGTMTLPLISFDDGNWACNSDVIVEMIEKKYPERPLVTPPHLAYLGLKILPKLVEFLKSKDETGENDASKQALLDELQRLEVHLSTYGSYVNGERITAVDLSLAPKLYHLECACLLYKRGNVLEDLAVVQKYKESLKNLESFKNTKPSPQNVHEGWRQRLTCK